MYHFHLSICVALIVSSSSHAMPSIISAAQFPLLVSRLTSNSRLVHFTYPPVLRNRSDPLSHLRGLNIYANFFGGADLPFRGIALLE
ncbi:hypothetical protein BX666DRAFT_1938161 [Dichotomocladium elegans]|nr:hypothetical protein BX666DRAFT_1938161 [Dichotomocladium elegans]